MSQIKLAICHLLIACYGLAYHILEHQMCDVVYIAAKSRDYARDQLAISQMILALRASTHLPYVIYY